MCFGTAGLPRTRALDVHVHARDGYYMLSLEGELDLHSQADLEQVLDGLANPTAIVLDLRKLSFIDSRGLSTILSLQQRCDGNGIEFSLTLPSEQTQRVFAMTGLLDVLPFADAERLKTMARSTSPDR
jgi:anti-anti-sigma factor